MRLSWVESTNEDAGGSHGGMSSDSSGPWPALTTTRSKSGQDRLCGARTANGSSTSVSLSTANRLEGVEDRNEAHDSMNEEPTVEQGSLKVD